MTNNVIIKFENIIYSTVITFKTSDAIGDLAAGKKF